MENEKNKFIELRNTHIQSKCIKKKNIHSRIHLCFVYTKHSELFFFLNIKTIDTNKIK